MVASVRALSSGYFNVLQEMPNVLTRLARSSISTNCSAAKLSADRVTSQYERYIARGPSLTHNMLSSVIAGGHLACVVPQFIPPKTCGELTQLLLSIPGYEHYEYAPGVGRIGYSYSETHSKEALERYYHQALPLIEKMREVCGDLPSPIDTFRLKLQEAWQYGANFEMLEEGRKMFVGLGRMIEAKQCIKPHQDMIQWYANYSKPSMEILETLTMNIYMQIPESGGELELWNWGYKSEAEYKAIASGSYGIDKSLLPPPDVVIKPKLGDLIIFNPTKLHCIATGSGHRFTVSSFIGFHGGRKPLTWWS